MTGLRIRVYECIKGVSKVSGLQKEDLASGSKIGVLPAAVSLLLAEDRIEFSVVLEGKRPQKNGPPEILWLGYHFFGQFSNLQRCFRKKHRDPETIFSILHQNLTTKFSDPFASPLLLMGDNNAKGFWQISSTESPHEVLGFIPLHRTDMFHTLKSYPIIFFEGDKAQVIVGSDVDRNSLYHANAEVDSTYTQTLKRLSALYKSQKWCSVVLPENSSEPTQNNNDEKSTNGLSSENFPDINAGQKFDLRSLSHWLARHEAPLTLVYGLSLWRKGTARDFDLATLGASASGRSHLVHYLHTFTLSPHFRENEDNANLDLTPIKAILDKLVDDLKEMKSIVGHGTAIYNPFFEKSRVAERGNLPNPSLVIESHSLKLHNTPPKPSSYKFHPPVNPTNETPFQNEDQSPKKPQKPQLSLPEVPPSSSSTPSTSSPRTGSPRIGSPRLSSSPVPMSPDHQQQLMNLLQQRQQNLRQQRQQQTPPPSNSSSSSLPLSSSSDPSPPSPSMARRNEEASQFLMEFIKAPNKDNSNPGTAHLLTPARFQTGQVPQQAWSDPRASPQLPYESETYGVDSRRLAHALVSVLTNPNYLYSNLHK